MFLLHCSLLLTVIKDTKIENRHTNIIHSYFVLSYNKYIQTFQLQSVMKIIYLIQQY